MVTRKIRGNKKRFTSVQSWIDFNKNLDVDNLLSHKRDYCKLRVDPWGTRISVTNSTFPEPHGKLRLKIIQGLIEIYNGWKLTLDDLNKPYYLKIWLYEPNLSKSQVVCAVDDYIEFYSNTFNKSNKKIDFKLQNHGHLSEKLSHFNWDLMIEEQMVQQSEIDEELDPLFLKELLRLKKKSTATYDVKYDSGYKETLYGIELGNVWIGSEK